MPNLVQPIDPAAPPDAPQAPAAAIIPPTDQETPLANPDAAAAPEEGAEPPEALMKIPAFQALFAGSPPALSYDLDNKSDREERKIADDNAGYLKEAGFGIYKTLAGDRGVIYNSLHIHPEDIAAADKAGKLKMLAPDFDAVNHAVGKAGVNNPIFHVGSVPTTIAASRTGAQAPQSATQRAIADRISGAPAPMGGSQPLVAPASAGAQNRVASARVANMKPTAPTAGTSPGQGALLAAIQKPVV